VTAVAVRAGHDLAIDKRANATVPLRIMPLGASVTFGVGSTTGNSYRKDLRDALVSAGHTVNMVGTQTNGAFVDNDCEAYSGFVIAQIAEKARNALPQLQPNVVLVDAGTNNCNRGEMVPDAGRNVTALVEEVFTLSPGATVVLTTLLVNTVAAQDTCRVDVNGQYVRLASELQAAGKKLVLVDMRGSGGPTTGDLADGRHPNDVGYGKMAKIWLQGILDAQQRGFLTVATNNGIAADGGVPTAGQTTGAGGAVASAPSLASASCQHEARWFAWVALILALWVMI
jgi:lysophospholipase L1-like esterase